MIVGRFERGRPFLRGDVLVPRIGVRAVVNFLVDTGADVTCLHPKDSVPAHVPFERLGNLAASRGIGGQSAYFVERAVLSFRGADGRPIYEYDVDLYIGRPEDVSNWLPSLLGQDVLKRWRMVHDPASDELEIQPRDADYIIR